MQHLAQAFLVVVIVWLAWGMGYWRGRLRAYRQNLNLLYPPCPECGGEFDPHAELGAKKGFIVHRSGCLSGWPIHQNGESAWKER